VLHSLLLLFPEAVFLGSLYLGNNKTGQESRG